ncbi:hypothetical protein DI09_94p70 [Mitosporidium daphniae]|uniref:RRM domain-containing protein n=1 Tax=Mitosporidium daphniae TaxID=1485682 RepID=A0A098VLR5_9MICR|nr:uncharacterized protein DI09_94p70 [Mitosporidium daphniae]KGG50013.1 hypothetical protein DI09_94p70 [Mitosporidium daphniae]|eukprot:XP_013236449.1 uncharacterized protein DI09_94p70 [Mitosporidium daphniae]
MNGFVSDVPLPTMQAVPLAFTVRFSEIVWLATLSLESEGPPHIDTQAIVNTGEFDQIFSKRSPTGFLLLRGLDPFTEENSIYSACKFVNVAPKRVFLARDKMTRVSMGFAFVEYPNLDVCLPL